MPPFCVQPRPEAGLADYPVRVSALGRLCIVSASAASAVQIGDREEFSSKVRALALQREAGHAEAGNVYFESYSIFSRELPSLPDSMKEEQAGEMSRSNRKPRITVGCVDVTAVSAAASVHVGNARNVRGEARIKHIRQFARPRP